MKLFLRQWQVAYRLKPEGSIFSDTSTPFIVIPNTRRYTAADPFLFTEKGILYLFVELFDKKEDRGKLGYAIFDGEKFSDWKMIISEPYHLSYPNIFKYKDDIYIIPESNESDTLYAYRAVNFPDKWEKIKNPILKDRKLVDTTFLDYNEQHLMFTYDIADNDNKKLYVYSIDESGNVKDYINDFISNDDSSARPGGNFFTYKDDIIRVSQDCTGDYGIGVVFSRIKQCSPECYEEERVLRISPKDVKINKNFISGLHTYNANEKIEVIDFHVIDFDPMVQVRRVLNKLRLK